MRQHKLAGKIVATVVALVAFQAASAMAADPNGTWKWSFTTQNGQEFELTMTLKAEGENLTGDITLPMGDKIEIKDGVFKNDEVSFSTEFKRADNTIKTKYKGKVEGDTIKGKTERERNGEVVSRDWEPKRQK
jgi:hypothetical protein